MRRFLLRLLGRRVGDRIVARHATGGGILDVRFGLSLFRDPRVPVRSKLAAVALGALVTVLLQPLEVPFEVVWAVLAPPVGLVSLLLFNGLEALVGPIILGALLVRRFTPPALLHRIRAERYGAVSG